MPLAVSSNPCSAPAFGPATSGAVGREARWALVGLVLVLALVVPGLPATGQTPVETVGLFARAASGEQVGTPRDSRIPAAPTGFTARPMDDGTIRFRWNDHSDNETAFVLLSTPLIWSKNEAPPADWNALVRTSPNETTLDLGGVPEGDQTFAVRAENEHGASEASNGVAFSLPPNPDCFIQELLACLSTGPFDGRFHVWVVVWTSEGLRPARRRNVDLGQDSTLFYFFDENNVEMLIKVLDGCAINEHFWVFAAAATDLRYEINVWDSQTGALARYTNPPATVPLAIADTKAFAVCGR